MGHMNCEQLFQEGGPFFHLHTLPLETDLLFRTPDQMNLALNMTALAICESDCRLLAFAIMNNHLHFILEGKEKNCLGFYDRFQHRLAKSYRLEHRFSLAMAAQSSLVGISSLKQLRDEIIYVIRNPFVVDPRVHVFAYPWTSGYLYFNPMLEDSLQGGVPAEKLSVRQRREFKRERNAEVDNRILIRNGVALPASFTDYRRAMSFFENARQYIYWTLKNVEAQVSIANRMGELANLDDMELWNVAVRLCKDHYKVSFPKELGKEQLVQFLTTMKYQYHASNAQLARCFRIPLSDINAYFPLSAKQTIPASTL